MPYIDREKGAVDCKGTPINVGDILESTEPNPNAWRYFGVWDDGIYGIAVRDFNAHNVGMCDLGLEGNVINRGSWKDNMEIVNEECPDFNGGQP